MCLVDYLYIYIDYTASTKRCYSVAISIAFSVSSPHFDPTIKLPWAESGFITEHNVLPHVQVPVHVLPTPAQTGLMMKGSHGRPPGSTWGYQKLKTRVNSNSKISCLALAEKIWQFFHWHNPHTQLCFSSHKCMFLTNVAPFKREINRLSNGIRFIAKKHC